jgi:RNA polymerase sigma factor (sigma-70 family)
MIDVPAEAERNSARITGLVRRAQRGDAIALDQVLTEIQPYVGRLCGSIALQDGQDAAQEALIAVFRALPQLTEPAALFGWVRSIAVREAVRVAKRSGRLRTTELGEVPSRNDPELAADVHDVLSRLTPEHRAVLVLRDLEGLDQASVAAILAVPAPTVRTRLFRARRSFRREWESTGS